MKLGFVCKYTPVELFEAMGDTVLRLEPHAADFNRADTMMHPNTEERMEHYDPQETMSHEEVMESFGITQDDLADVKVELE